MLVHRFPFWICEVMRKLCVAWNTLIVNTKIGNETSPVVSFNRGLSQGYALCPCLFTLCNVLNVRRGVPVDVPEGFKSGETFINSLKEDTTYWFLAAPERLLQEEKLALQCATKTYLQRLSVIWSSPLSDTIRVQASNQLAMPVLLYLMWSQHLCLTELRNINRQARKIVCESGGKHPLGLKGRGMRSVEEEYKMTEIKSAIKLYSN